VLKTREESMECSQQLSWGLAQVKGHTAVYQTLPRSTSGAHASSCCAGRV